MIQKLTGIKSLRTAPMKTARMAFRLSEQELVAIARAAEIERLPPAEFARQTLAARAEAILAAHKPEKPPRKKKA